ncbi:DUF3291 domain-containing protein [Streptomyces galbus]|uniref:DUF3291 domain-containing protein n=1 Tax=Streptomyces galbus TaxID=33898 RepID=A0A4U5W8I3_STRGB|nr:DUF3291 domain-containing protein [Streptomyces galbus]TKS97010.1 DUF3291 domain-containing protein [Streptomyces galbus]GHD51249.1 hypothetical protein GCM10010335_62640 [Streptomyces galbus]
MAHLALYTFGVLKAPLTDPAPLVREFHARGADVYPQIARHPGYLAHAEPADPGRDGTTLFDLDWGAWGTFAVPAWYDRGRTPRTTALAATLSLWTDLPSAVDGVYSGHHRAALTRRHDWFERTGHPTHVCWWVTDGTTPTWEDGVRGLEDLHAHGSAPHAFTFRRPFTPEGAPSSAAT